jgi:hypothetical protein
MYHLKSISFPFLLSFLLLSTAQSFLVVSNNGKTVPTKSVQFQKIQQGQQKEAAPHERGSIVKRYGLFDGLKGAFSNEKYDSKPNAGLKKWTRNDECYLYAFVCRNSSSPRSTNKRCCTKSQSQNSIFL